MVGPRRFLILLKALEDLSLEAFVVGITNISFTKTVAVSLNEVMPFALRNSFMDKTEAWNFLELAFSKQ